MRASSLFLVINVFVVILITTPTFSATSTEFQKELSELKKSPDDSSLREKIIKHYLQLTPKPQMPKEAQKYMIRGATAIEMAKNTNDFKKAADEFRKASNEAPWVSDIYYNLGVTFQKSEIYDEAVKNFKLYLLSAPKASDAKDVQNLIYKLEYLSESKSQTIKKTETGENLTGTWYVYSQEQPKSEFMHYRMETTGDAFKAYAVWDKNYGDQIKGSERLEIRGSRKGRNLNGESNIWSANPMRLECLITEDSQEINCKQTTSRNTVFTFTLRRE